MLEILWKVLFFLSMLVVYANVTSTSIVIVIVLVYVACVFSYYYFDNIQGAIDEWFHYLNVNARLNDTMNPVHLSGYFVNRKFNKMNNNNATVSPVVNKKIFGAFSSSDGTFGKENNLLDTRGTSILKSKGDLPSPIMRNSSPPRNNRLGRDSLKLNFNSKMDGASRKNTQPIYGPYGNNRRYNTNLDLETYMNVNSPGFTSRVVDKAAESASYHIKYPAVRQIPAYRFDKSTLRQLSKIPKGSSTPGVRIAPPEPSSIELLNADRLVTDPGNENLKSNDYLQVLKDISRKRNYCQEETDRSASTPKKSRKSDIKNALSSQYKRAHEDCSNDSIDDKSCKKRCDDIDRNYAKMMSFTSSMSVLVPEFSWSNNSKKRKSSRLEKSVSESPEKMEKCRKIDEDGNEYLVEDEHESHSTQSKTNVSVSSKPEVEAVPAEKQSDDTNHCVDQTDSLFPDYNSPFDGNEEYVRVAGGKILNRTNCTYRKKLNSTKIDPVSVISTEPEYISDLVYVDDKTMKENLLNNLVNDIEKRGEKNDSVIFYQNSIVEEIEKKTTSVEAQKTDLSVLTSSSLNPLLPPVSKPAFGDDQIDAPSSTSVIETTQLNASMSGSNASQPFNINFSVKPSKVENTVNIFEKPSEKTEVVAEVHRSNSPPPTFLQQSTKPITNTAQFAISSSIPTSQPSIIASEANKPNIVPAVSNALSPAFAGFKKTELTSVVGTNISNNNLNENTTSSQSLNPLLQSSTNLATGNKPSSTDSVTSSPPLSNSTSANIPSLTFGDLNQTTAPSASTNDGSSLFTFSKPADLPTTTSKEVAKLSAPTFNSSNSSFSTLSSLNSVNPTSSTPAQFSNISSVSCFPTGGLSFGTNTTAQSQTSNLTFGAQSASTFGQTDVSCSSQNHIFGATTSANTTSEKSIFGASQTIDSSSNIFGIVNQPLPANSSASLFGAGSQPSAVSPAVSQQQPTPVMFGTGTQLSGPTSVFGSNATSQSANIQPSIFGSTAPSQSQQLSSVTSSSQSTLFGSGDTSTNVFGQNQSTAPPVGVVNPLPQSPQFGGSTSSQFNNAPSGPFAFTNTPNQPLSFGAPQTSTRGTSTASSPFGNSSAPQQASAFGGSSGSSGFNFNPSSTFGAGNSFGTTAGSAPAAAASPMFNFSSSNVQSSQPAFQFGSTNSSAVPNPPFMFGSNAAPMANAGGFSIGSGGGSNRNRPMARPRKAK